MGFWLFMLFTDLLIPAMMIGFGRRFQKHPPRTIQSLDGYRTPRSMQNMDTWRFAHRYFGGLWLRWGLILLPLSVIPLLCVLGKPTAAVGTVGGIVCALQLLPLIGAIVPTERALHRTFDKNGFRRAGPPDPP